MSEEKKERKVIGGTARATYSNLKNIEQKPLGPECFDEAIKHIEKAKKQKIYPSWMDYINPFS